METTTERPLAKLEPAARNNHYKAYPPNVIDPAKSYVAVIRMAKGGEMRVKLYADKAPKTVNNFVFLANDGFYDGTTFHRVLANFMAQGGDPSGKGSGGPGYKFQDEVNNGLSFSKRGLLAMANAGPGTNGSQFFITFTATPHLNNRHTIFGEVISGDDVLGAIKLRDPQRTPWDTGDVIKEIVIEES
jgi:cyclophilin family peptidyl-prolyl cis-trans isomerase